MKLKNGVTVEFVTVPFQTYKHHCADCYFHENGLVCDDYIENIECGVTKVYKEVK
jgi:hypothetical protein